MPGTYGGWDINIVVLGIIKISDIFWTYRVYTNEETNNSILHSNAMYW